MATDDDRVLLLGMNNPLSDDPRFDLFPYPDNCSGFRLWKMLPEGTTRRQYLSAFERRNLLRGREWSDRAARREASKLLPELNGRLVVVLGSKVRAALGLPPAEPLEVYHYQGPAVVFDWIAFPHPSGRNLWFNQPENQERARSLLAKLFKGQYFLAPIPGEW